MTTAEERSPGAPTTPREGVVKGGAGTGVRARGLWPERYELIDAWRGIAALLVCVHHVASATIGGWTTKIGGPAVMLFFVISGYCIAASADSCRRKGLGLGTFMMRRVRRIYPPYLLSLAFWIATRIVKKMQTGENDLAGRTLVEWVQNLTLTQWVTLLFHPSTYAAKNPTNFVTVYWSLGYEEQFYLVMGLFMVLAARLGWSVTAMTGVLMAVGLGVNIVWPEVACGLLSSTGRCSRSGCWCSTGCAGWRARGCGGRWTRCWWRSWRGRRTCAGSRGSSGRRTALR